MEGMVQQFFARDYRKIARDKLRGRWGLAVGTGLVAMILMGGSGFFGGGSVPQASFKFEYLPEAFQPLMTLWAFAPALILGGTLAAVIGIGLFLIGGAVEQGWDLFNIRLCRDEQPRFGDLFARMHNIWKALGLRLFMALFIFLWALLLWVPGIIAAYRYAMAPYLMAQNPALGIREAVNISKEMMRGRKGRLFCLHLSFIGWALLSVLTFGIGFLWLEPYMKAAEAAFYLNVSGQGIPKSEEAK